MRAYNIQENDNIAIARPISVWGPGLLNIIFSSHNNMCACKKSAPFDPIWPRLARLALLAKFCPVRLFLASFCPVWPSLTLFGIIWHHLAPFCPDWPHLGTFSRFLCTLRYQFAKVETHAPSNRDIYMYSRWNTSCKYNLVLIVFKLFFLSGHHFYLSVSESVSDTFA